MAESRRLLIDIGQGLSIMVGLPTVASWKTKSRPKNAKPGTFGYNSQVNQLEYFDGSNWYSARLEQKA